MALVALVGIGWGGAQVPAQSAGYHLAPAAVVGRTSTVCTVAPAERGSATTVSTVVIRQTPEREGTLTATAVGQSAPSITLRGQGKGRVTRPTASQVLEGVGAMATGTSGEVFGMSTSGEQRGLMAAPCGTPATEHWFVGVGASSAARSELILTNPDDTQAEVDLQFFGVRGEMVVPGSPGVVVNAHASRTISLESLISVAGPLTVSVKATTGRVAAVARDVRSNNLEAAGADWQTSAVPPTTAQVIPGIPGGAGSRELVLTNPGQTRADVNVQVLAQLGPFAPVGANHVLVQPGSTTSVPLAAGLVGLPSGVRLSSDQPVAAAVVSTSQRAGAAPDFAVQSATPPLVRTGVVAVVAANGVDSELVLSNGSDAISTVSLEVLTYDGVSLKTDDVLIGGYSSSTRRLNVAGPAYLVLKVPAGSDIHGGVTYAQPEGKVAGLATTNLTSPDVASRAPTVAEDPTVGR